MLELIDLKTALVGPVTLRVAPGETITVSGPSGSGKSRLLRAIADLDPFTGEVRLDGTLSTTIPPAHWRRKVQLLPADPQWWAPFVGEHFSEYNIEAARMLGFPADVWGWPIERLSSGERQRLALLRALDRRPQVLLLDEPTANLDEDNVSHVEDLIERYQRDQQAIVIWVSHNEDQRTRIAHKNYRLGDA